ncbi:MAG TPA: hypothetical protein VGE37_05085, partial [Archangium sp.]
MRSPLLCVFIASLACAQPQPRLPIAFDAGLGAQPARTQQKRTTLEGKLPSGFVLPADFTELASGPDGVTPPTTRVWLAGEMASLYGRAASPDGGVMTWPAGTGCDAHRAFTLAPDTLLAAGAPGSCGMAETAVRNELTMARLGTCLEVAEPERFVSAFAVPSNLNQTQLNAYVDQRTNDLLSQIGLAGAGLRQFDVPAGLLPVDFVPMLRSVVWKLRAVPHDAALQMVRTGYGTARGVLSAQASCFDPAKRAALDAELQSLEAEVTALDARLDALVASGTARADQQRQCVVSLGRTRPVLPEASLTDEEREFVGFWLGGVFWRMRGGGLLQLGSTQNARTYFARRPFRQIARVANDTQAAERAADSLYCALFDGWGEWMDLGTTAGGQDFYEDLVQLTDRGRQQVQDWTISATGAAITNGLSNNKSSEAYLREAGFGVQPYLAGGLSMGPCYAFALNPQKNFVFDAPGAAQAPYSSFIDGFTAQGEFCFGASLGLGLVRTLLAGTPSGQPPMNFCATRQCGADPCGVSCGTCSGASACDANGQCVAAQLDAGTLVDAGVSIDA